jgi:hypothetical protein
LLIQHGCAGTVLLRKLQAHAQLLLLLLLLCWCKLWDLLCGGPSWCTGYEGMLQQRCGVGPLVGHTVEAEGEEIVRVLGEHCWEVWGLLGGGDLEHGSHWGSVVAPWGLACGHLDHCAAQ